MAIHDAAASERTFLIAARLASEYGMTLTNPSEGCYQLRGHSTKPRAWILNLYPRRKGHTPRVYADPNRPGPFLAMRTQWTLLDAVNAAIRAQEKGKNDAGHTV